MPTTHTTTLAPRSQADFAIYMATRTLPAFTDAYPGDPVLDQALTAASALLDNPDLHTNHFALKQAGDSIELAMANMAAARETLYARSGNANKDTPYYLDSAARTACLTVSDAHRAARAVANHNDEALNNAVRAAHTNAAKVASDLAAAHAMSTPVGHDLLIAAARAERAVHLAHLLELCGLPPTSPTIELSDSLFYHYHGPLFELVDLANTLATPQPSP